MIIIKHADSRRAVNEIIIHNIGATNTALKPCRNYNCYVGLQGTKATNSDNPTIKELLPSVIGVGCDRNNNDNNSQDSSSK